MDKNIHHAFYDGLLESMSAQVQCLDKIEHAPLIKTDSNENFAVKEQFKNHESGAFFMRVNSCVMEAAGIYAGDIVIVDRTATPQNGKIIIAILDGEMLIRRYEVHNYKKRLFPATQNLAPIEIVESSSFIIWGVVTYVIHKV